ncbi:hypothetical protein [Actinomadura alba]|uniref:Uncharacterized protein n=1 Tax=Actinomadura alba TaxID=406431 RepID=A0ABR7LI41_9ACTN|nr:hypothetical protein [Actinomadura alba]MBC6464343.1 hypothetical protein [Actinomadura alba]
MGDGESARDERAEHGDAEEAHAETAGSEDARTEEAGTEKARTEKTHTEDANTREAAPGEIAAGRRGGRGASAALGGLILVAGLLLGGIAMDAGWLGGTKDPLPASVPVSRSAIPDCAEPGPCESGAPRGVTADKAPAAKPSARPAGGTANGGADSGTSAGSGGRPNQTDLARRARDGQAPRPPSTSGVDQDEIDRQRDEAESTVVPEPADNGPTPAP